MKVYLASSISQSYEKEYTKGLAKRLEDMGFEVYAAACNDKINDKSNDPTPLEIYEEDIRQLATSRILLVNLTGSMQDGTISEVGWVSGYNTAVEGIEDMVFIIGYTTNTRLLAPQFHRGVPSASANHLVFGMIEKWGIWAGSEDTMLDLMEDVIYYEKRKEA